MHQPRGRQPQNADRPPSLQAKTQFDLFRFSDAPIMERLGFMRTKVDG